MTQHSALWQQRPMTHHLPLQAAISLVARRKIISCLQWERLMLEVSLLGEIFLNNVGAPFLIPGSPTGCAVGWTFETAHLQTHPSSGGKRCSHQSSPYLGSCLICPLLPELANSPLSRELDPGLPASVYPGAKGG